ncbi:MAG: hypothetical protein J6W16_05465 [Methanobrevibacter sp.]|nr:hypothetical protein [Methanobrevibacter sp.]MBP5785014.1 hypothetical protein [Methanobrevibacter sp.]
MAASQTHIAKKTIIHATHHSHACGCLGVTKCLMQYQTANQIINALKVSGFITKRVVN